VPPRLVILDRDGVINVESDAFVKSADEWKPLEGSLQAIRLLTDSGFTVAVASNQSGLGRGLFDFAALDAMHSKMHRLVEAAGGKIDRVVICPHHPDDDCDCRKPKAGLLLQLADHYGISLAGVPVIGDSARDIEAAIAVGARPVLVLSGNGRKALKQLQEGACEVAPDLLAAARLLVEDKG